MKHNKKSLKVSQELNRKTDTMKSQGHYANSESLSDQGRGVGSSYANAVGSIMDSARNMKGSKTGFLGVDKKSLDAKEYTDCSMLYNGKKKK